MNSYIRFKLALTEDEPTIKPYTEDLWAELPEAKHAPIEVSLALLDSLHQRWMLMLREFTDAEWKRTFPASRIGPDVARKKSRTLLLARTPSRGACHELAREDGLVRAAQTSAVTSKSSLPSKPNSSSPRASRPENVPKGADATLAGAQLPLARLRAPAARECEIRDTHR